MSQAFTLASQIMQSLNELKRANFVGVLPRNQLLVDRFYIAIGRASEKVGEHILRGVEETIDLEDTPSDSSRGSADASRREQELANVSQAYEKDGLKSVSIQERACLLAMYNHLRAVSRADMLVRQSRLDYWQKDFDHAEKDKRHLAGTTTHYLNIYTSTFNYPDDNKDISDNAEVKDTQYFDPETGHKSN